MKKFHPRIERIEHRYFAYLDEAKRLSTKSVNVAAAITDFEKSTDERIFRPFISNRLAGSGGFWQ